MYCGRRSIVLKKRTTDNSDCTLVRLDRSSKSQILMEWWHSFSFSLSLSLCIFARVLRSRVQGRCTQFRTVSYYVITQASECPNESTSRIFSREHWPRFSAHGGSACKFRPSMNWGKSLVGFNALVETNGKSWFGLFGHSFLLLLIPRTKKKSLVMMSRISLFSRGLLSSSFSPHSSFQEGPFPRK